jgi:dolichyl-phosphate-mannose-protein mannosyltransferase
VLTVLDWFLLAITMSLSLFVHRVNIGFPPVVAFDEVFFGTFANCYHNRVYFFDIHPPLGKQLLYLGGRLSGYSFQEVYDRIGSPLDRTEIRLLRSWPCMAGVFRGPLIFVAVKIMGGSAWWALTAGIFVATDQAMVSESRLVLVDSFLLTFAALTICLTAMISRRIHSRIAMGLAAAALGIASGATVSVKFTGGGAALAAVAAILIHYPFPSAIAALVVAAGCGMAVLIGSFVMHFSMLKFPGPGCIHHTPEWCTEFAKGRINPWAAAVEVIPNMLAANFAISDSHRYASPWWSWPLMLGCGTYLWVDGDRRLWTIGSPVVWWGGALGLIAWVFVAPRKRRVRGSAWLAFGWAVSYLPLALIRRPLWNYHYLLPLLYAIVAGAVTANAMAPRAVALPILLSCAAIGCWAVYIPITYGAPISREALGRRTLPWWTRSSS